MGLSLRKLFKAREKPGEDVQRVSSVEIADQQVRDAVTEICLRELAFWTCVGKIANALTKCEFRTFYEGEELFKDEYYLWNYEPNRNQNKAEFLSKAMEQLFRNNELLIVESYDGQLLVADDFSVTKNALYGDTYTNVQVDDYTFSRSFRSSDVLHWTLNNKNVNRIMQHLYDSYSKLIDYSAKSYLKSRGSRGTLNISAMAQSDKLFNEKLEKLMNEYFKSFFESPNAVLPLFEGYSYTDIGSKTYSEGTSRDIKSQYDDIFDFTARGFSMPPTLAKGDVQDTEKAVDEMLTFCLDPLAQMFMQEINRKRIGRTSISSRKTTQLSRKSWKNSRKEVGRMPRQDKVFVCFQKAEDDTHKLYIYDDVTAYGTFNWSTWSYEESETSAKYFQEQLAAIPDTATIELHINSNGGSVKEGVAIYSQLKQKNCKKVGYVDGVAYSVAFLILQACDERVMGLGTSALIHNMWMSVDGNAKELRKAADDLDTLMESNRQIFLEKSNLEEQQLIDMMEAETFLTPEKALEYGLIDRVDSYQADDKDVQQRLMSRVQQLSGVIAQQKSFREQLESMRQQGGEPKPPVPTPKPEPEEKKLTNQLAKLFQNM